MQPFTHRRADSIASLGEVGLITFIKKWLGNTSPPSPAGIGDDCAILAPSSEQQVITVDPVIFNRHFDQRVAPQDVGAKLLKRNLSDLAAMGAKPTCAVVALILDPEVKIAWVEGFYRGLARVAAQFGVAIVGGDVAQAPGALTASLTLLGRATSARLVTRSGARRGDWIYVTGKLGGSFLGHHYTFVPRLPEGTWLARQPAVRSMMDLSDGLAKDVFALTPRDTRPALWPTALPVSTAAATLARKTKRLPLEHALVDGEDYELVFTLAKEANRPDFERRWRKKFQTPLTCIGNFVRANAPVDGAIPLERFHGYEHLR